MAHFSHQETGATWNVGQGLWWRDEEGVHGMLVTRRPSKCKAGRLTTIVARSLADLNRALAKLGFGPLRMRLRDIAWKGQ